MLSVLSLILLYMVYYGDVFDRWPVSEISSAEKPRNDKYFVYSCRKGVSCGGWGDRQKGVVAVYLMANATNSKFRIQLVKPCDFTRALRPKSFNWRFNKDEVLNRPSTYQVFRNEYGRILREKFTTANFTRYFSKDVTHLMINSEFSHYIRQNKLYSHNLAWLKDLSMAEIFATIWRDIMVLSPELQKRYKQFVETKVSGKKLVCAQIRVGQNRGNSDFLKDNPRMSAGQSLMVWDLFRKYTDPAKYKLFLTTDDEGVRSDAKRLFPGMLIESDGPLGHVDLGPETDKTCDAFKKVILDQHILSTCDVLITSFSGIGRHAAYVRGKETDLYCLEEGKDLSPCNFSSTLFQPSDW
ncbi:hypothetical protein SNE40_011079 [Patella caerulea]|uniref:Uncharacterized protein n=1 Tax=Patella caerulea TaxID=87958 RepID=A0AAN8PTG0_PATCE